MATLRHLVTLPRTRAPVRRVFAVLRRSALIYPRVCDFFGASLSRLNTWTPADWDGFVRVVLNAIWSHQLLEQFPRMPTEAPAVFVFFKL